MNNDGLVFSFRKETIGFTQFDVLMRVVSDQLKMAIRWLTRHISSACEKNQDFGNEDVATLALLQWIYKWGSNKSRISLT